MNQSKFSLADVLTALAALTFGFFCFLSMNFFTLGDTTQSLTFAIVFALLLGGLAFGAKLLKTASRNFKTCFVWEMVLLLLFAVIAIVGISPFSHYFAVSEQKDEIQSKVEASITQAENLFAEYELYVENRGNLYKSNLQSVVYAKKVNPTGYANLGFTTTSVSDAKQIEDKMFSFRANLLPSNYNDMKQKNSAWLSKAKSIIGDWKPIGIAGVVTDVEKNSKDWLNELIELSTVREKGEDAEDFSYDLSFDDVKTKFETSGSPTIGSIFYAIGLYALMLLSYFLLKRDSRTTGALTTASYEVVL